MKDIKNINKVNLLKKDSENRSPFLKPNNNFNKQFKKNVKTKKTLSLLVIIFGLIIVLFVIFWQIKYKNAKIELEKSNSQVVENQESVNKINEPKYELYNGNSLKNKFVTRNGKKQLIILDQDYKNPKTLLTTDKDKLAYAGSFDQEGNVFYYVELNGTNATLFKKDLNSESTSEIFNFNVGSKNIEYFDTNLIIRKDLRYVVYGEEDKDISLYDLKNETTKKLFVGYLDPENINKGFGYYITNTWSPNGKYILASKIYYEGAENIIIDPLSISEKKIITDRVYGHFDWLSDDHVFDYSSMELVSVNSPEKNY